MKIDFSKQNRMMAIFKLLSNTNRIAILRKIYASQNKELNVSEILDGMKIKQSSVSNYLNKMRIQKIVKARQDSHNIYYSISDSFVVELIKRMN
jgi:DNA-binding transcriptional ArsR family regulator